MQTGERPDALSRPMFEILLCDAALVAPCESYWPSQRTDACAPREPRQM